MVLACDGCDVVFSSNHEQTIQCPNCEGFDVEEVDPGELTQEQKEATQQYVYDMARHETLSDAIHGLQVNLGAAIPPGTSPARVEMLDATFHSCLAAAVTNVYARMMGVDPWALAFEGAEKAPLVEETAQRFSDLGFDVEFSWSDDSPFAAGKAVPKAEIVREKLEELRRSEPLPMPGVLAEKIAGGYANIVALLAAQPEAVPPEGRATVAKTLHELLDGRDQVFMGLDDDTYSSLVDIIEEFQVPHSRDIFTLSGHTVRCIAPHGEDLEEIRSELEGAVQKGPRE